MKMILKRFLTYPINRNLNDAEKKFKLNQTVNTGIKPRDQLAVISINSTFLELSDFYHAKRGVGTLFGGIGFLMMGSSFCYFGWSLLIDCITNKETADIVAAFLGWIIAVTLFFMAAWMFLDLFLFEAFGSTHYPIRLNRKNRMVYVYRRDKTILEVPWDKLFFNLHHWLPSRPDLGHLRAHVVSEHGVTVLETFAFCNVTDSTQGATELWEFIRKYMEEGPELPASLVKYCLPIGDRREPFLAGCIFLAMRGSGNIVGQLLFTPMWLLLGLGRWLASWTSEIPVWPKSVEEACAIDPGDPLVKNWHTTSYLGRFGKS